MAVGELVAGHLYELADAIDTSELCEALYALTGEIVDREAAVRRARARLAGLVAQVQELATAAREVGLAD